MCVCVHACVITCHILELQCWQIHEYDCTAQKKYRQDSRRRSHFHNTPGLRRAEAPCILSSSGNEVGLAVAEGGVGVGGYIVSGVMRVSLQEELQERANWAESAEQIRQEQMELQSCLKERPWGRILVTSDYLCAEVFWRSPGVLFVCPQGFSFPVAWCLDELRGFDNNWQHSIVQEQCPPSLICWRSVADTQQEDLGSTEATRRITNTNTVAWVLLYFTWWLHLNKGLPHCLCWRKEVLF